MLGFTPQIYSSHFSLATQGRLVKSDNAGMKFVPGTVYLKPEMVWLIEMGVDGIISDYP